MADGAMAPAAVVSAICLLILLIVMTIDLLSAQIRQRFIGPVA